MTYVPGPYRVADAATWCVEQATLAAAELLRARGTDPGPVSVDPAHAMAAFRSERHLLIDGESTGDLWSPLSGDYKAADGWVRLHCNYPHHEAAALTAIANLPATPRHEFLAGPDDEDAVAVAPIESVRVELAAPSHGERAPG
ncbi:CAIB/BAIF family protein [Alloactinosynnema sp. L-07]|uniref:hypothetical protein n=1 Tax=Alloactinosynnema sp. L-07 TaxID=1653480 RepID=UPI00065EF8A4|nr:CAIB/BAIF family protein [Alloactinosynnema sp. L-07]